VEATFWIVMVVVVGGFSLLLTRSAFKGLERLQFHCRRCDRGFRRRPYRRMPARCPHCHSSTWQL